jgi:hypothetical protein
MRKCYSSLLRDIQNLDEESHFVPRHWLFEHHESEAIGRSLLVRAKQVVRTAGESFGHQGPCIAELHLRPARRIQIALGLVPVVIRGRGLAKERKDSMSIAGAIRTRADRSGDRACVEQVNFVHAA